MACASVLLILNLLSVFGRKLLILKELIGYNGDLYFLQEVDQNFYEKGLKPIFKHFGYDSSFLCKDQLVEGLSILYNRTKFVYEDSEMWTIADLLLNNQIFAILRAKVEENSALSERITKLKNSFLTLLLRSKFDESKLVLVCNLHLYSKDDADHIRLIQAFICFKYIEYMAFEIKNNVGHPFLAVLRLNCYFAETLLRLQSFGHRVGRFQFHSRVGRRKVGPREEGRLIAGRFSKQ